MTTHFGTSAGDSSARFNHDSRLTIRRATPSDAEACGSILYNAFRTLADHHRFSSDIASLEVGNMVTSMLMNHPQFHAVVAEEDGRVLGSNFIDFRSSVAGVGPISVDPQAQNRGVGRRLMQAVMGEANRRHYAGIRLFQVAYHNRSLCLYTTLGFRTRDPASVLQGKPLNVAFPGYQVRPATEADMQACEDLCRFVHGFDRGQELREAMQQRSATVVEHLGRVTGYTTGIGHFSHSVAATNQDLMALIGSAQSFDGAGFILPTGNEEVFRWCLANGLRLVAQVTQMTIGLYSEPRGAWMPSILC